MKTHILPSSDRRRGFSLVETTIAVGIAATVLVALVGLIPVSLDTLREASNTTAAARIIQAVSSDYRMREWSDIVEQQQQGATRDYSFDGQGTQVKAGDASAIFTARVTIGSALPLPGQAESNPGLRSLKIWVTGSADPEAAFARPETCKQANSLLAQTDDIPGAPSVASN